MPQCLKCGADLPVSEDGTAPVLCDRCAGRATRRARFALNAGALMQFPATSLLVAINTAVLVGLIIGGGSLFSYSPEITYQWGANVGPYTLSGDYWRLVTASFIHANLLHYALNMWCLWSLCRLSEQLFGSAVTLAIYVLTGVGGAMLSIGLNPLRSEVGASAAVFGLAGAVLSGIKFGKVMVGSAQRRQIFSSLIFFVVVNLSLGQALPLVDNTAHIGGLVAGFLFGAPLASAAASGKKAVEWGAILLATLVLVGVGSKVVQLHGHVSELRVGGDKLIRGDAPGAIHMLQRAVTSNPADSRAHVLLGQAYESTRQRDLAIGEYQSALRLNPDFPGLKEHLQELQGSASPVTPAEAK